MKQKTILWIAIPFILLSITLTIAQSSCPAIVQQALQSMGDNCADVGRNSACYGYNLVSAQFATEVEADYFTQPADTTPIDNLETIETAAMSVDLSQWGVAVLNLQANIPNSLPGQSVKFVLLGDVAVENSVLPDASFASVDPLDASVISSANIRGGAGQTYNVIGSANVGDTIPVDGKSSDGLWYRTIVGERIGWVFHTLLEPSDELTALPVIDGKQRSPMQSFYLRTGVGQPACEEAPEDTLMVQGPKGIEIDLTVNGADIKVGSTILIRILPPGDTMEFVVIDGKVTIPGGGPNGTDLYIYENYRSTVCLGEPENRGLDGNSNDRVVSCDYAEPEFVPDLDLGDEWCELENVPDDLLNYSVDLLCPGVGDDIVPTPDEEDEPEPTEEPTPDFNLCAEGNAWDDGRCVDDWWWNAGYYYGAVEEGIIGEDDIPSDYLPETPEPEEEDKPFEVSLKCVGYGYQLKVNSHPRDDKRWTVEYMIPYNSMKEKIGPVSNDETITFFPSFYAEDIVAISHPSGTTKSFPDIFCAGE